MFLSTFTSAKMMDAIAIIVEGEPITTAEIHAIQTQAHLTKQQAVDLLIQDRLQKAAMRDIDISESEIDKEVSTIAEQNGVSIEKMQKILKKQGSSWSRYRESIRDHLKKRAFFRNTVSASIPAPTDDELKSFYTLHQKEFTVPRTIKVTEYKAAREKDLKKLIKGKTAKGIHKTTKNLATGSLNPSLMKILLQTPNGNFTTPMNAGDNYIVYKVHNKSGNTQMPFESAKSAIAARWRQQQQTKALKDYFQKMKTEANIQIIRK
jgi:parvulin-like peptidyl-prolyl isomerase